ncbi:MAG: hypothetical protein AAFY31_09060 [Pseudomonadota bacterium]
MTLEQDYKMAAHAARKSARETLIAFRNARRSARSGAARRPSQPAKSEGNETVLAPESLFQMTSDAPEEPATCEVTPSENTEAIVGTAPTEGAESVKVAPPSGSGGTVSNMQQEPAPISDATMPAAADSEPSPLDATEAHVEEQIKASDTVQEDDSPEEKSLNSDVATVDLNSDLFELPGAGAGMIWMFNECGIHSMADLAMADQAELTQRLGVVGRILNVEPWMAFAREARMANGG